MNQIMVPLLTGLLALVAGGFVGWVLNNRFGRKSLEAMKMRVDEATRQARRAGEKTKRRALLESKEEILRQRQKYERDTRSRKGQLAKREKDIKQAVNAVV